MTVKSLLQHHGLKASVLWCSAFLIVQLSHPYMTGKTIALTRQTFVGKVMSSLFNMLSRLVTDFLPRSYESESEVAQSCLTLCDSMDCSLPDSSVHGIFQAIVLEWIAISFSRGSSRPRVPGSKPRSPALQADTLTSEPLGKPPIWEKNLKKSGYMYMYN